MFGIKKFDVKKRQDNAFQASRDNAIEANKAISMTQNWILVLGTAELTFLGVFFLSDNLSSCVIIFVKILIAFLFFAFLSFIWGAYTQSTHLKDTSRMYNKISDKALEYLNSGKNKLDNEPEDLKFPKNKIISSKISNFLFSLSFISISIVTFCLIILLFVM
ncbi:MAG: hypothetical protein PHQ18_02620 [Patescibacteria group bacterium]|nr:hypothetical protein [Patescibacteria group bacterium]